MFMKTKYIKPEIEVVQIEAEPLMMMTSGEAQIGQGEATEEDGLTNRRRGTWGNLWSD